MRKTPARRRQQKESATATTPRALDYRMPAEWERHEATWLAWPHSADWPGKLEVVRFTYVELVRILATSERVRLIIPNATERRRAERMLFRGGADLDQVDWLVMATDRSWTRDFLPLFIVRGRSAGASRDLGAVKWHFNGWARYPNHELDEAAGQQIAKSFAARVFDARSTPEASSRRVVFEGGAIDVDGQGSALVTEECLVSGRRARNRWLGREGTERVLSDYLGIDKTFWIARGIAGDDTSGHVDDFVRFVAPGRVVIAVETNRRDENYAPLREAWKRLRSERDAKGRSLELIELPMPEPVYFGRQRLPASYANFYISNRVVLVPTFNDPADRSALQILAACFADREVIGVYCRDLVLGLGTIHCATQQEPRAAAFSPARSTPAAQRRGARRKASVR